MHGGKRRGELVVVWRGWGGGGDDGVREKEGREGGGDLEVLV